MPVWLAYCERDKQLPPSFLGHVLTIGNYSKPLLKLLSEQTFSMNTWPIIICKYYQDFAVVCFLFRACDGKGMPEKPKFIGYMTKVINKVNVELKTKPLPAGTPDNEVNVSFYDKNPTVPASWGNVIELAHR